MTIPWGGGGVGGGLEPCETREGGNKKGKK